MLNCFAPVEMSLVIKALPRSFLRVGALQCDHLVYSEVRANAVGSDAALL